MGFFIACIALIPVILVLILLKIFSRKRPVTLGFMESISLSLLLIGFAFVVIFVVAMLLYCWVW